MACRITELGLDAIDVERIADFWCAVLGWERTAAADGSVQIRPPGWSAEAADLCITVSPAGGPKREKLRLHIDVNATDRDQAAELERLLALGAVPADVGQAGDESWHVLADPEGNEFCLLRRTVPA
jgi:predicted enzyme related to lactoylglutathione lyase